MTKSEKAAIRSGELFESGFYCAESVLQSVAEAQGISSDTIPRVATGFCSGIARSCGQCGAVSGAIMGLGLVMGRNLPEQSVEEIYATVRRFLAAFEKDFGSTNCQELTGCDLGTEAGQKEFLERGVRDHCRRYTEAATALAMALIVESSPRVVVQPATHNEAPRSDPSWSRVAPAHNRPES